MRCFICLACAAIALLVVGSPATGQQAAPAPATTEEPIELKVGDVAPEFEGVDQKGEPFKSIEHVGKRVIVLYFYPKDMTPGCTAQACSYRDSLPVLEKHDVQVIGVSGDTVESHQAFIKKERLNFTLLADPEGKIAKAFGVQQLGGGAETFIPARWTFVIDREGHIAYKDDKVKPADDVTNVLKVVAGLKKE